VSAFTYEGNWKYQLENCSDGYHVTSVHPTYLDAAQRRARHDRDDAVGGIWQRTSAALEDRAADAQFGSFQFAHGHVAVWSASEPGPGHPLFGRFDELVARVGETRARWMFYTRNVTIFPNLQIVDNFSSQVRVMRPLGPHRTEMSAYCVGPLGEDPAARTQRLRQYEDFFMPSGMATPDDLVIYEDCQRTGVGARDSWQGYDRGMAVQTTYVSPEAAELGLRPTRSVRGPGQLWDETLMQGYYRAWRQRIAARSATS
jgi:benzoate/toluate 1,2-dioxygenase alpha subunit